MAAVGALALLLTASAGCGHPRSRAWMEAARVRPERAAPSHDAYEILVRTRVVFDGEELATLRTRVEVFVRERADPSIRFLARVVRIGGGDGVDSGDGAFSDVDVRLDGRGALTLDPLSLCPDPGIDDLSPTRVVRHVLGSLAHRDGDDEGALFADFAELDADAAVTYALDDDGGLVARASGRGHVERIDAAGWHFSPTQSVRMRSLQHLDRSDGLVARTSLMADAPVRAIDPDGRAHDGTLEIRTDVVSRPAAGSRTTPEPCAPGGGPSSASDAPRAGDFDVQAVIRLINTRRAAITRCYETELRRTPTVAGRIEVTMTIEESGDVTNVHSVEHDALEDTTAIDTVAACVVRVISGFHFSPGPTGGAVTYSFPFVFEPTGSAAPAE